MIVSTIVIMVIALSMLVISPGEISAQDPVAASRTQLTTAIFHSGELAQRGTAVSGTQLHLQHVINCLEGAQGRNFKIAGGHVCQGQGNGILVDLRAAVAAGARGAETSLNFADVGSKLALQAVVMTDVNEAQPFAIVISRQLTIARDALGR